MRRSSLSILILLSLSVGAVFADATIPGADIPDARDPEPLRRFAGSFIVSYTDKAFDELALPVGPLKQDPDPKRRDQHNNLWFAPTEALSLEGQVTRAVYVLPQDVSPLQVVRSYRDELTALDGQVLFECKQAECGGDPARSSGGGGGKMSMAMVLQPEENVVEKNFTTGHCAQTERITDQRYLAAALPGQDMHLAVLAYVLKDDLYCKALSGRTIAVVQVVRARPREQKMVVVEAPEMARAIASEGRIALYGILFDFDRATLRPESAPVLTQIAVLLADQPELRLLVVGHTDNAGSYAYNRNLSAERADAVAAALAREHGVDKSRLLPVGVGFAAPVASNATEDGRAKNRRVELVAY